LRLRACFDECDAIQTQTLEWWKQGNGVFVGCGVLDGHGDSRVLHIIDVVRFGLG
jgi:hypothetical protein